MRDIYGSGVFVQASIWGFNYEGVSELGTTGGGPFASIFYTSTSTHEDPFIVLVFKGESLFNVLFDTRKLVLITAGE